MKHSAKVPACFPKFTEFLVNFCDYFWHLNCTDLLNDEGLRLGVEKFQKGEWKEEDGESQAELKNEEQEFIRSAEDEIKAKAAKKAAQKRELPDSEVNGSPAKKANLTEVQLCKLNGKWKKILISGDSADDERAERGVWSKDEQRRKSQ